MRTPSGSTLGALIVLSVAPSAIAQTAQPTAAGFAAQSLRPFRARKRVVRARVARATGQHARKLSSEGFGPDRPIGVNETEQGRKNNRRVEFLSVIETWLSATKASGDALMRNVENTPMVKAQVNPQSRRATSWFGALLAAPLVLAMLSGCSRNSTPEAVG